MQDISVILPVVNDAPALQRAIEALEPCREEAEVIVVDGGSRDDTRRVARAHPWVRLLESEQGRARQMNAGAAAAQGEVLLFLHADTLLSPGWPGAVRKALSAPGVAMGCFSLRLDGAHPWFRLTELGVALRTRFFRLPYGDQGFFMKRSEFCALGGYAELPIMEDVDFVRRARRRGTLALLRHRATTSGRRWRQDGMLRRTLRNLSCIFAYFRGEPPAGIARRYPSDSAAIAVFCKVPVAGTVKTRLAAGIGDEQAARIYRHMAEETLHAASRTAGHPRVLIFYAPQESYDTVRDWLGPDLSYIPQSNGDLGHRMLSAFQDAEAMGLRRTLIIGTDCPAIDESILQRSLESLREKEVVLGPTEDGGYYLIGSKTPRPELFRDIEWSTDDVLPATMARVDALGLEVELLATQRDLDTEEDLRFHRDRGLKV